MKINKVNINYDLINVLYLEYNIFQKWHLGVNK